MPIQNNGLMFITTFAELTEGVREHIEQYPSHGRGCICLDQAIRAVRNGLDLPSIHAAPEGMSDGDWISQCVELSTRVEYILRQAAR